MTSKRRTGNDYLKEYNELTNKAKSLTAKICNRFIELVEIYPDAIVEYIDGVPIQAKTFSIKYVPYMNMETVCTFIMNIEAYSEQQSGHVQTKMF